MTRQKKIILIALFFFFIFALAFGIYLFPDNDPMIVAQTDTALKQIPPLLNPKKTAPMTTRKKNHR